MLQALCIKNRESWAWVKGEKVETLPLILGHVFGAPLTTEQGPQDPFFQKWGYAGIFTNQRVHTKQSKGPIMSLWNQSVVCKAENETDCAREKLIGYTPTYRFRGQFLPFSGLKDAFATSETTHLRLENCNERDLNKSTISMVCLLFPYFTHFDSNKMLKTFHCK